MSEPRITWVNHASYILDYGIFKLITDPWIEGSAFNDGWDLLVPSVFDYQEFETISHIWFSHEHPDHFAPSCLKQIPETLRPDITVLYQETKDRKVLDFCQQLGFNTLELREGAWQKLGPDVELLCGKVPFYDSWLFTKVGGRSLLNLNDCVLTNPSEVKVIREKCGSVDVLLSQFSYADWIGNPDQIELRTEAAAEKLKRLKIQIELLQPQYLIPFASFVYFSHETNFYLNDAHNTVMDAVEFAQALDVEALAMYPGDVWAYGDTSHNDKSLPRYTEAYELSQKSLRKSPIVDTDELEKLAIQYCERILHHNDGVMLKLCGLFNIMMFQTLKVALWDGRSFDFDLKEGLQRRGGEENDWAPDITTDSDSLAFMLRVDWGLDSLLVNGRFRASAAGSQKMLRVFALSTLNNTGRRFDLNLLFDRKLLLRIAQKLGWSTKARGERSSRVT